MEKTIMTGVLNEVTLETTKNAKDYLKGSITWQVQDFKTQQWVPCTKYFTVFDYGIKSFDKAEAQVGDVVMIEGNYNILKNTDNFGNTSISGVNFNVYKVEVLYRNTYKQAETIDPERQEQTIEEARAKIERLKQQQRQEKEEEEDKPWELDL